jgi:predicted TIM-barrel fold metal-dependent hydrolase
MSMTRRTFGKGLMAGVGGAMLGGDADAAPKYPKGRYVDIHTHLGQEWGNRPALSAEELLRWMDENSVAQSIVLPLISPESWDHPISTDYVLKHTGEHRDRLIPFCSIDPRTINLGSYKIKLDLLKKYQDAGAKGFGEHKPGVAIDDPRNLELFKACAEVGFPVLFHLDNSRNTDKPGLPGLENVLRQVPDGIFIGHAQGWWASISGDVEQATLQRYPKEKVAPGGAIDRLMDKYPNLYGDLSAGSGANSITRDLDFGREFLIRRSDRLLFGTDYLAPEQAVPQFKLYGETLKLPKKVQKKIFRDNARRILGI